MPGASAGANYRKNTRLKLLSLGRIRYDAREHGVRKLGILPKGLYALPLLTGKNAQLPVLPLVEPELVSVPPKLEAMVAQIQDLGGLYWDYEKFGEFPTEDEFVAHFVIPLLSALGWPPERVAVKWRDIDVAVFSCLPRTPVSCRFIIEAKRLGTGVEGALGQAKGYVEALGLPRDIVVTDGIRYRMYSCENGFAPVAYANLSRLKQSAIDLFERIKRP